MSRKQSHNNIEVIAQEAAQWMVDLESMDNNEALNKEFIHWLQSSPIHIQEFLYLSYTFDAIKNNQKMETIENIIDFYKNKNNIIPLSINKIKDGKNSGKKASVKYRYMNKLTGFAAMLMLGLFVIYQLSDIGENFSESYLTTTGEQISIKLADGTVIELNTETEIKVEFSRSLRQVVLLNGEAIFNVAKNPNRPFRVISGIVVVEVVGTKFNIYKNKAGTTVTVVEGLVNVKTNDENQITSSGTVTGTDKPLKRGEQITVNSSGLIDHVAVANITNVTAWTERKLIFKNDLLESVVNEINRYSKKKILIKGEQLKLKKINGTFNANNPKVLLEFLSKAGGIEVTDNNLTNTWMLSQQHPSNSL